MTALLWLVFANAQTLDTVGGTGNSNTGNWDYKLVTYDVTSTVDLLHVEMRLDQSWYGPADVTWVVYAQSGIDTWDLVWEAPGVVNTTGAWVASPAVNVPLDAGRSYAIGVYLGFDAATYFWDNSTAAVSFGQQTGGAYNGNGSVLSRPDPLNDSVTAIAYRQRLTTSAAADADGDGSPDAVDCDDVNPAIFPGAPEVCGDNVDQDCSGVPDDNLRYVDYWPDDDLDGFGDAAGTPVSSCDGPPAGMVDNDRDCLDSDGATFPDAPEACDGLDQDCDGVPDDGVVFEDWWPDGDSDGFGDAAGTPVSTCDGPPETYVAEGRDCDDTDDAVFPGAPERCNTADDDCDGEVDEDVVFTDYWPDDDGDGFGDVAAAPEADCVARDGMADNNDDCNDAVSAINPDATEFCDGLDNDCDGVPLADEIDSDLDGALDCADCDALDPDTYPGAEELCDGVDRDCDGVIPKAEVCDPNAGEGLSIGSACGCAQGGAGGGWLAWGLALVAARRRR